MVQETYFIIKIEKIQAGIREQQSYEKKYESDHPIMLSEHPPDQYGYRSCIKPYTDRITLLEQRLEGVDIDRILKAVNKNL